MNRSEISANHSNETANDRMEKRLRKPPILKLRLTERLMQDVKRRKIIKRLKRFLISALI